MPTAREVLGRAGDIQASGPREFERAWHVQDAASELEAQGTVFTAAPSLLDGLVLTHITATETAVQGAYDCIANYGLPLPPEPKPPLEIGDSSFHFEVSTQPVRVNFPLSPQTVHPRDGLAAPADSDKWLIGQQGDGSPPEGVEVFEPRATFSESHVFALATITAAQQKILMQTVGKICDAAFRGWAAEEVMLTRVSGSQRSGEDWEISFGFEAREHQTGLTIAGIEDIDKKGWQYLWPRYSLQKDANEPILSAVIDYIVVADVHPTTPFGVLGIGS